MFTQTPLYRQIYQLYLSFQTGNNFHLLAIRSKTFLSRSSTCNTEIQTTDTNSSLGKSRKGHYIKERKQEQRTGHHLLPFIEQLEMMSAETGKQMSEADVLEGVGQGYMGVATKGSRVVLAGTVFCLAEAKSSCWLGC